VEAAIQEQLYGLMDGRTVIAIAHRLSTIAVLDRLIVMDEGRIVDDDERSPTLGRGQVRWASPGLPQRHYRSLNARERTFIDPMQAL
jgi:ABC-type protease/lipase transport system fused ATPase/permease subunit